MALTPFIIEGRSGVSQEMGDGIVKLFFDDGEIRIAVPATKEEE